MTDDQIKHMVDRFLGWRLPENFTPDAGISFARTYNEHTPYPMKHEPIGTNLFDAQQAEQMVRYMVEGMPCRPNPETQAAESKVAKVLRESIERVRPIVLAEREGETIIGEVMNMILKGSECPCCYGKGRIPEEAPNATVAYLIGLTRSPVEAVPVSALRELVETWRVEAGGNKDAIPLNKYSHGYQIAKHGCADRLSAVIRGTKT